MRVITIVSFPQAKIYKSHKELKKSIAASVGVSAKFLHLGSFSASLSYKSMQHSITSSSKHIEKVNSRCTNGTEVWPGSNSCFKIQLNVHFLYFFSRLL